MSTYDHKQVLSDYDKGKITPEMATGHSLQHIDKLYDALKSSRQEWQAKFYALDQRVTGMQTAVDRLQAVIKKARAKQKLQNTLSQPQVENLTEQPNQP